MSRNSTQYVCLNALAAAVLLCSVAAARGKVPDAEPDVIVYLQTDAGHVHVMRAKEIATAMFADIGVRLAWAEEGRGHGAATSVVLHIHIADRAQPGRREAAMAYAYPFANGAKAITIMWDRLQPARRQLPGLAPALLAHVMVHEITHVLQGVDNHSATGVMKASWTLDDFKRMYGKPLPFTATDARLVQSGLTRLRGLARADRDSH